MSLYKNNHPKYFWHFVNEVSDEAWQRAMIKAMPLLGINLETKDIDSILQLTLGEGQFGLDHWELGLSKRLYYLLKPLLPRTLTKILRKFYRNSSDKDPKIDWPIESRYVLFQWDLLRHILNENGNHPIQFDDFWPDGHQFAFVLTHDIETAEGQAFVRVIADLEEKSGFRSSFNFVLERYPLDFDLIQELRDRGFEVGCHGLKHDGKLFNSRSEFERRAEKINSHMKEYEMVGFRSPLTHRNPEWMQILNIEYDASFFDTDPFEPIPGGAMSIWPYFLGHFVELPYTLVQDYTLVNVLGEKTPGIWLEKVEFIRKYHGMALLNSHPDYLKNELSFRIYDDFLQSMKKSEGYWHALPCEVARWWNVRFMNSNENTVQIPTRKVMLDDNNDISIS